MLPNNKALPPFATFVLLSLIFLTPNPLYATTPQVAAGGYHTVGLMSDGSVVAVGRNSFQQCNVEGWSDIVQVSAGYNHTVGLKSDGTVVAVGFNYYGQINIGDWSDIVQISAGRDYTVGIKSDGTVVAVGDNYKGQCNVGDWSDIVQVSAGYNHTVGLKSDGTVVAVGINSYLQCNVGNWSDIVQVSAGHDHTVGLKSDGTVVAVGDGYEGQCNVGDWSDIVQVSVGHSHTVGLKSDGTVVAVGRNNEVQCNVGGWSNIVQISSMYLHTVGLKTDGTIVAVGDNDYGKCNVDGLDLGQIGYSQGDIIINIRDKNGIPLNGYLLLKLPPPNTNPLHPDMKEEFYPYFHDNSPVEFYENEEYFKGVVLKSFYVVNGSITIRADDIIDVSQYSNPPAWKSTGLLFDETRFFFFYPTEGPNPLYPTSRVLDTPTTTANGDVTWWSMHYRSTDNKPQIQNVTMLLKNDEGAQVYDWTKDILCSPGGCYTPNHADRQNYVLEPPYAIARIYAGDKNPLVLIHGINGQAGYWEDNIITLRNDTRVQNAWAFNYRGTEDIPDCAYLLKLAVSEIRKFYNNEKKVAIATHSYGGVITRKYCLAYSDEASTAIDRILMIAPPTPWILRKRKSLQS